MILKKVFITILVSSLQMSNAFCSEVCNFGIYLKPGDIETCDEKSTPETKILCLKQLLGEDWTVKLDAKKSRFEIASTVAKPGLVLCFGKSSFKVRDYQISIFRTENRKKFGVAGISPGTVNNIDIIGSMLCGLSESGEMELTPIPKLKSFLPVSSRFSTKGFHCENDKEYSLMGLILLEPASICGFKAAKSTEFLYRPTDFWHFVAENSGTLTYKEANGKTVRVKIKDGQDYHIKRPDLNPCKWEKSSAELLEPGERD